MGSLTSTQQSVLIGSILGDGSLRRQGNRINALLEVNHSYRDKEYVDWKWEHFKNLVLSAPKARVGLGPRVAYRFTTRSLPVFTEYYEKFYVGKIKIVPKQLVLDPLSLAVWFMDDGTRIRSALYLNTQQFSLEEQVVLQNILLKTFGLESHLNKDKEYLRIRVTTDSSLKMKAIIEPYILPSLKYKLAINPVTTRSNRSDRNHFTTAKI